MACRIPINISSRIPISKFPISKFNRRITIFTNPASGMKPLSGVGPLPGVRRKHPTVSFR
ncbi:MAG: hypothetical protein Q8909_03570 [Bacteroidota bacterium]|nr:hypothetical protein [Bacteroidota bacterium]